MPVAGLTFLFLFLPVSVLLSQLLPKRWKDPAVLLCSLLFYAWGDGINLLLLPAVAAVAYFTGKRAAPVQQLKTRRGITGIGICLTLLTGILFKSGAELFTAAPLGGNLVTLGVELPLGFSFFILRMVGYQVDVARGRESARSLLEF